MRDGDRAPSIEIDRNDESFTSSVTMALGQYTLDGPSGSAAGPSSGPTNLVSPPQQPRDRKSVEAGDFGHQRYSPPPPMYTPSHNQGLPAGAAPSNPPSAYQDGLELPETGTGKGVARPWSGVHDDEEDGLAYMARNGDESTESLNDPANRKVRFGGVSDMDQEAERRKDFDTGLTRPSRVPVPAFDEGASHMPVGRSSPESTYSLRIWKVHTTNTFICSSEPLASSLTGPQ